MGGEELGNPVSVFFKVMVLVELFAEVEESNGTASFGGLVVRDDCRR